MHVKGWATCKHVVLLPFCHRLHLSHAIHEFRKISKPCLRKIAIKTERRLHDKRLCSAVFEHTSAYSWKKAQKTPANCVNVKISWPTEVSLQMECKNAATYENRPLTCLAWSNAKIHCSTIRLWQLPSRAYKALSYRISRICTSTCDSIGR